MRYYGINRFSRLIFGFLTCTFFFTLFATPLLEAHSWQSALIKIDALPNDRLLVWGKIPTQTAKNNPLNFTISPPCKTTKKARLSEENGIYIVRWEIQCQNSLWGRNIKISGLEKTDLDLLVYFNPMVGSTISSVLSKEKNQLRIPKTKPHTDMRNVVYKFLKIGTAHILTGWDHLLFVFGLILLVGFNWRLLKTITAFTIGHSITLSLATPGFVEFPTLATEAIIALSILFLATQIARLPPSTFINPPTGAINETRSIASRYPWVVTIFFGLLHGLGFAGALHDVGLPEADIPLVLFAFNLGVEIGQLFFILMVFILLILVRLIFSRLELYFFRLFREILGVTSAFWLIERVMLILG